MKQGLFHSVAPILAAPWRQRRNVSSYWGLGAVVFLVATGPLALFCWSLVVQFTPIDGPAGSLPALMLADDLRHSAANAGICALAVLAIGWWGVTVNGVLEQNQPVLARLVPEHAARLRAALVIAWAATVACVTLLVGLRFHGALACVAISAPGLALLAVSVRWPLVWILGCVAPIGVDGLMKWKGLGAAIEALRAAWLEQSVTIVATLAAAAALTLMALIHGGGRRHIAAYDARIARAKRFQMRARGGQPVAEGMRGYFDTTLATPYHAWWRFTFWRRSTPPFGRVMLGLGPGLHWTATLSAVFGSALAVALGAALYAVVEMVFPQVGTLTSNALAVLLAGLIFGLLSPVLQAHARLHQSRREQSLLTLLPTVPRGVALSRRLAWQLTAQFVLAWLVALLVTTGCIALAHWLLPGTEGPELDHVRNLMMMATAAMVVFQWRAWARVSAPTDMNALVPLLLGGVILLLAWLGPITGLLSRPTLSVACIGAPVAWCALRWYRMGTEPSALPMGRLA
jgi:hypothetical protein